MSRPSRSDELGEVLLVCEEPRRGHALLAHLGLRGEVRRVLEQPVQAARALFWVQRPVRWPDLEAQLRFTPRARRVVICHPRQPDVIELALREGASILTSPDPQRPLAEQVEAWLAAPDAGRLVAPEELANRMTRALERRLHRPAPQVRLTDTSRIDALVEKLAAQVLGEARGLAPDDEWLDWENETTAIQPRTEAMRFLRLAAAASSETPTARDPDLEETDPFARVPLALVAAPPDLVAFDDELEHDEARDEPPPAPPPPAPRRRLRPFAFIALLCLMGAAGGFGATLVFKDRLVDAPWLHALSALVDFEARSTGEPG